MKGLIFTSFLSYVEENFGLEFVDQMIDSVPTKSSGIYTTVGTYNHQELIEYLIHINKIAETDIPYMVENFGYFLFGKLCIEYPKLIEQYKNSLDCIYNIDQTIHKNVKKIYSNAELPNMNAQYNDTKDVLTLTYQSNRPFMYLAKGLILGCIDHYQDDIDLTMKDLSNKKLNKALFILK